MIRFPAALLVLCAGLVLVAAGAGPRGAAADRVASGTGNFEFGDHGEGHALFEFEVDGSAEAVGSLLFAAEEPHHYPDVIITADEIVSVSFGTNRVSFRARGMMHDDPVRLTVSAFDGASTGEPDSFAIKATGDRGTVVFEAGGELSEGDVQVGTPD